MRSELQLAAAGFLCFVVVACAPREQSAFVRPRNDSHIEIRSEAVAASRAAPEPDIEWTTYYRAARYHESTGNYEEAIAQYNSALQTDTNNFAVYNRLGILYGFLGKHGEAEEALRRAVTIKPEDGVARNNLGFEYILQEKWAEAERELRRAVLMDPVFDRARINLGVTLAAQEDFDGALTEFRRVLPAPDALYNLGLAYRTQGLVDDAERTFTRVLKLSPKFEAARRQLDFLRERRSGREGTAERPPAAESAGTDRATVGRAPILAVPVTVPATARNDRPRRGDFDGDGDVDLGDFARLQTCLSLRGGDLPSSCSAGDFDGDGDIDLIDYQRFQAAMTRP